MKLSKNLSLSEVIKSNTAIKHGIDNTPHGEHLDNLFAIAQNVFQPVRDHFGVSIAVTSGYRSEALNRRIGGSATSQHCKGEALDLDADVFGGVTNQQMYEFIRDHLEFDQLIHEFGEESDPDWVHVSFKKNGGNRKQLLRAERVGGKTQYKAWR